jgi:hypothetical protein
MKSLLLFRVDFGLMLGFITLQGLCFLLGFWWTYLWGVCGIIFTLEFGKYENKCTMVIPCKSYRCMLVSTVGIIIGADV